MVKLQLPCDLIVTHGEDSASVSLVSGFCPAMASDSKSSCGPQCAQCQWWGAIAFDEAVPPVHLAVAGRIATSDLPVAASEAPSADQPAAAELVIPDYPRSLRHLDRDFRVAKRDSPHIMTDERCRRMMAAAPELCRNEPAICFEHQADLFDWDYLWPIVCKLAQIHGIDKVYIGVTTDLVWRWSGCRDHPTMIPHCDGGWSQMCVLSCNWGDAGCAMERLLQDKLGVHFESRSPHGGYRRGSTKPWDKVFLYALLKHFK